jgi:replicative DNA helicase
VIKGQFENTKKEERLKALREYDGEDAVISSHEMALKLKESPDSIIRVKSFIPSLDKAIEDFRDGEVIVISGPTKMGKTLLAQSLTANFTKQQHFPLWFSYEVPARQFLSQFPELPLIYLPAKLKAHAMSWVEDRIQEAFLKYHVRIVFIDHLHFLFDLARTRNPSIEIGQVIRRLKTLAVNGGFIVFLLCHTTKGKSENDLSYESIRDSSFISQESDCVLMIKRTPDPDKGENAAKLRVEFHRRTGVLERIIHLRKINGYLVESTDREKDPGTTEKPNRVERGAYVD